MKMHVEDLDVYSRILSHAVFADNVQFVSGNWTEIQTCVRGEVHYGNPSVKSTTIILLLLNLSDDNEAFLQLSFYFLHVYFCSFLGGE